MKRVGGQALFHGVLMRCGGRVVTAERLPDGAISVNVTQGKPAGKRLSKLPLLRGIAALAISFRDMLRGLRGRKGSTARLIFAVVCYAAILAGVFLLSEAVEGLLSFPHWLVYNLYLCGVTLVELALVLGLARLLPPVRRLFGYHAAEHMAIHCYEKGLPLTLKNVREQSRVHPRCGSNLVANCIVLLLLETLVLPPIENELVYGLVDAASVILILGIAYEGMKYAERHNNLLARIISACGTPLQKWFTTIPPKDEMLECAVEALKMAVEDL